MKILFCAHYSGFVNFREIYRLLFSPATCGRRGKIIYIPYEKIDIGFRGKKDKRKCNSDDIFLLHNTLLRMNMMFLPSIQFQQITYLCTNKLF